MNSKAPARDWIRILVVPVGLALAGAAFGVAANHEVRLTKVETVHEKEASQEQDIKRLLERMDTRLQQIDARTVRLETYHERSGK